MAEKARKDTTLSVRIDYDIKDFYVAHKGLATRVLKDFFNQWDTLRHQSQQQQQQSKD